MTISRKVFNRSHDKGVLFIYRNLYRTKHEHYIYGVSSLKCKISRCIKVQWHPVYQERKCNLRSLSPRKSIIHSSVRDYTKTECELKSRYGFKICRWSVLSDDVHWGGIQINKLKSRYICHLLVAFSPSRSPYDKTEICRDSNFCRWSVFSKDVEMESRFQNYKNVGKFIIYQFFTPYDETELPLKILSFRILVCSDTNNSDLTVNISEFSEFC